MAGTGVRVSSSSFLSLSRLSRSSSLRSVQRWESRGSDAGKNSSKQKKKKKRDKRSETHDSDSSLTVSKLESPLDPIPRSFLFPPRFLPLPPVPMLGTIRDREEELVRSR